MNNFSGKLKELEKIKLNEVTLTLKDKSQMFSLVGRLLAPNLWM